MNSNHETNRNNQTYIYIAFLQNAGYENRWGEVVRLRLQYDEARKQVSDLQQQLVTLEDEIKPGQNESDKDRLVFFFR